MPTGTTRLDQLLVERGLAPSRARARDAILRGCVTVADVVASKPGQTVSPNERIKLDDPAAPYVSRAALKLVAALDGFGVEVEGRTVLDLGASTGGFTQVCLERGASRVFALDVGHGQMAAALSNDLRVIQLEGLNARDLTMEHLSGERPDVIVCDVSFISLKLALPPALALAGLGAHGVFLVKPQFEVGRDGIGKGGLVRSEIDTVTVARDLSAWLDDQAGWHSRGVAKSPVTGGDGNVEWLMHGQKAG